MLRRYDRTLTWALDHPRLILTILLATIVTNFYLYSVVPKGFFPQQDTGRINGAIQADQSISFQLMRQKLQQFVDIIRKDPAVDIVVGFTGGGQTNGGFVFMSLKPLDERKISADQVIRRLRGQLAQRRRGVAVPAGGAGHKGRRPRRQCPVSIHSAGRHRRRTLYLGAEDSRRIAESAATHRREQRPAESRARNRHHHRPRNRGAARDHGRADRQYAL